MDVRSSAAPRRQGRRDFLSLGKSAGLRVRAVERALDQLRERAELWIRDIPALPFDEKKCAKLRRSVEYRRMRLLEG